MWREVRRQSHRLKTNTIESLENLLLRAALRLWLLDHNSLCRRLS
jgi:hypothetical protein